MVTLHAWKAQQRLYTMYTRKREPFLPLITERLTAYPALSSVRLLAECRAAGYTGGYSQLTAHVRTIRPREITAPVRNVAFFHGLVSTQWINSSALMRERIDSPAGRTQYAQRFATVEPAFANLRANKRLDRFTLRGRAKVDTQWKLYCLVHNAE